MTQPKGRKRARPAPARAGQAGETLASDSGELGALPSSLDPTKPAVAEARAFREGDRVADRFVILRFLARGGMGEVYEARDLELNEILALKTVRPEIAREPKAIERFKREVQLARRVTHPNVCRIFDLWSDTRGRSRAHFVTMELLHGETLDARLARVGRWKSGEALPLLRQLTAGLDAAHRAGIVHRDLKSGNVMLVPTPEGERAVITDFGLAHEEPRAREANQRASHGMPRHDAGAFLGTPAYMAPEQLTGGPIGPWTDLYALGVLLYELVTGTLPFDSRAEDEGFADLARRRLQAEAPSPRRLVPELDPRWEAAILRALERAPERRFTSALELWRAISEETTPKPRVIALLPLDGDEAGWRGLALQEALARSLALDETVRVVTNAESARASRELSLTAAPPIARDLLARLRARLFADLVVGGAIDSEGVVMVAQDIGSGAVRFEQRFELPPAGEESETLGLTAERAAAALREVIGLAPPSDADAARARASLPSSLAAMRGYAEGIALLRAGREVEARDSLARAVEFSPDSPLVLAALADAEETLGYEARARDAIGLAFQRSTGLARTERLELEARYRRLEGDWRRSIDLYRSLSTFYPDNLDYAIRLLESQLEAGRTSEAMETLEGLKSLPPPLSDDVRLDLWEAEVCQRLSDYLRMRRAADRLIARARELGASQLLARGLFLASLAARHVESLAASRALLEEARRVYEANGDRGGVAQALHSEGNLHYSAGDPALAARTFTDAIRVANEVGRRKQAASSTHGLAMAVSSLGDAAEAIRLYREALAGHREVGSRRFEAATLNNLGSMLAARGDFDEATALFREGLAAAQAVADSRTSNTLLHSIGGLLIDVGRSAEARPYLEESVRLARTSQDRGRLGRALSTAALASFLAGDARTALGQMEEAIAAQEAGESAADTLRNRITQGEILRAVGRYDEAEAILRQALRESDQAPTERRHVLVFLGDLLATRGRFEEAEAMFEESRQLSLEADDALALLNLRIGVANHEVNLGRGAAVRSDLLDLVREADERHRPAQALRARVALARVLLGAGDAAGAEQELHRARAILTRLDEVAPRFTVALTEARVLAALGGAGRLAAARELIEETREAAARASMVDHELDARLALGELELASGEVARGHARRESLAREARSRGHGLISSQAEARLRRE
ncbi:MAG: tetratricopeptide repeat protein [Candidatus Eisenbacteria bacterium]